jgi:hypothetical protein
MAYLRQHHYKNVGVLKFRIKKGDTVSDSVGTLNATLADRLETALLFAEDPKDAVNLIRDASKVAATIPGADHHSEAGRNKLFGSSKYPLLWGQDTVTPDAFITGMAVIRPDRRTMSVALAVINRKGLDQTFDQFVMDMDPDLLIETGASFRLRGLADNGEPRAGLGDKTQLPSTKEKVDAVVQDADLVAKKEEPPPLPNKGAVVLEIWYDDQQMNYQLTGGNEIQIPEPRDGQRVKFVLRKTDKADVRYGVVVKVNGENTLFMEKTKAEQCTKWILSNQVPEIPIEGYQVDEDQARPFIIRSPEESKAVEKHYGRDVGQISLVVFREKTEAEQKADPDAPPGDLPRESPGGPAKPADPRKRDQDAKEQLAIDLGLSEQTSKLAKAQTLEEEQQNLREDAGLALSNRQRGLIGDADEKVGSGITRVAFKTDPVPIEACTIAYYRAAKP